MAISVVCGDLFEGRGDAILLPISVDRPHGKPAPDPGGWLAGNLARVFARRFPDAWEIAAEELEHVLATEPNRLAPGRVVAVPVEECPFAEVYGTALLLHGEFPPAQRQRLVQRACHDAVLLCRDRKLVSPLLVGGWRLDPETAAAAMRDGYLGALREMHARNPSSGAELEIRVRDQPIADRVAAVVGRADPSLITAKDRT